MDKGFADLSKRIDADKAERQAADLRAETKREKIEGKVLALELLVVGGALNERVTVLSHRQTDTDRWRWKSMGLLTAISGGLVLFAKYILP